MGDGVPIEEWTGELSYRARLSRRDVVAAKASLNRALVRWDRPETRRSIHEQVEGEVKLTGGLNRRSLKRPRMTCG